MRTNRTGAWLSVVLFGSLLEPGGMAVAHGGMESAFASGNVIVAIPDNFPAARLPVAIQEHTVAVLLREPSKPDMIVLNSAGLTPVALSLAVDHLGRSRDAMPEPDRAVAALVTTARPLPASAPSDARFASVLDRVAQQAVSRIGDIGKGRWGEVSAAALGLK